MFGLKITFLYVYIMFTGMPDECQLVFKLLSTMSLALMFGLIKNVLYLETLYCYCFNLTGLHLESSCNGILIISSYAASAGRDYRGYTFRRRRAHISIPDDNYKSFPPTVFKLYTYTRGVPVRTGL